jgi:hypothetical protein
VFATLARGPWLIFMTIACYWQSNAEAWPSQETIASFSGYSARAVRVFVTVLERLGVVRLRRERRPNGSERIYYAPGLVTLVELAAFVERFPRERAKPLRSEPTAPVAEPPTPSRPLPTTSHLPEVAAGAPPERVSMEHRDQDQKPSSCQVRVEVPPAPPPPEEQQVEVTKADEDIACRALAERMAKKHPMRPAPRWFDVGDVAMVAACAAALGGDAEAKMTAQRDAIAGAFLVSKDGPPTVRFIWEKLDHFLDHVDRGHRRRLAEERAMHRITPPAPRARPVAPTPMPDDIAAELEKLFGPRWRKIDGPR